MTFIHGKNTIVKLNGVDLSAFTNMTDFDRGADEHDVTCYGKNDHVLSGGLGSGKTTISGVSDDGAAGPRAVIEPLIGTVVAFIHQPEGAGVGKPTDTVNVLVKSYKESSPVADMVKWSAELSHSDAVTTVDQ